MTGIDIDYFKACHSAGLVSGNMLEVGAAKVQGPGVQNLCEIARELGVADVTGADLTNLDGVDVVFDFGLSKEEFDQEWRLGKFSTVCVFNVLEHTFDPLTVLENALACVQSGGHLLVLTPSIWNIHSYPGDFCRLLPDWYRTFAQRNGLCLLEPQFSWLSEFGIEPITNGPESDLPSFTTRGRSTSKFRYWTSRVVHKLFNTYGRSHWATFSAIGAVFLRP
jgi:SAM-dependent methyltransferase